jgi:hypothetical protein
VACRRRSKGALIPFWIRKRPFCLLLGSTPSRLFSTRKSHPPYYASFSNPSFISISATGSFPRGKQTLASIRKSLLFLFKPDLPVIHAWLTDRPRWCVHFTLCLRRVRIPSTVTRPRGHDSIVSQLIDAVAQMLWRRPVPVTACGRSRRSSGEIQFTMRRRQLPTSCIQHSIAMLP